MRKRKLFISLMLAGLLALATVAGPAFADVDAENVPDAGEQGAQPDTEQQLDE